MLSQFRSAWAWVLVAIIVLPLFPVAAIYAAVMRSADPRGDRLRVFVASWVSLYAITSPLYHFRVEGREHLEQGGPFVLVANHESGLDILALLLLRTPARFVAEDWLFRLPWVGSLLKRSRHIPVKIGDRDSGRGAMVEAEASLASGTPVAFYPEGDYFLGEFGPFKPGAFVAAKRAGVRIVPVLIEGTGEAWRPGTVVVHGRHDIRIAILEPVPVEQIAGLSAESLSDAVRERMEGARTR